MIQRHETIKINELKHCNDSHNIYISSWDNLLKQEYYAKVVCKTCKRKTRTYKRDSSVDAVNSAISAWNKYISDKQP